MSVDASAASPQASGGDEKAKKDKRSSIKNADKDRVEPHAAGHHQHSSSSGTPAPSFHITASTEKRDSGRLAPMFQEPGSAHAASPGSSEKKEKKEKKEKAHEKRSDAAAASSSSSSDDPEHAAGSPSAAERVNQHLLETIPPEVLEKIKGWKVRQAALHGGTGKTTSKTHPFKPPATFQEAMDFLKSQSVKSCTLVFTNSSAIGFADGKYLDFDNFEDDE